MNSNERTDILITDWNLQGETGEEAFKKLLKEVPGFYPMWIIVSAAIHPENAGRSSPRRAGADQAYGADFP